MNLYETIIIINPDLSEEDRKEVIRRYTRTLTHVTAYKPIKVDDLGVKGLAYPIKKHKSGHYALFTHYASDDGIKALEELLNSEHDIIIKYAIIRQSEEAEFNFNPGSESEQPYETIIIDALDVALGLAKY